MKTFYLLSFLFLNANYIQYHATEGATTSWTVLATNNYYTNVRMKTSTNFRQRYISRATPRIWAQMDCAKSCTADKKCLAFSFYERESYYACDLAGDNYCVNRTTKALISKNGSFVWDKISPPMNTGCFKPGPIPCENVRPGCKGYFPNCTQCIKSCKECYYRYLYVGLRTCTLWPDGDGPDSDPINVECDNLLVTLFNRKVNLTTGEVYSDDRLSFEDMGRLHRVKAYTYVRFIFTTSPYAYFWSTWKVAAIEDNGTLTNITFATELNIFNLSVIYPSTLPFITVTNDTYGCGSFWLLDPKNATYCPGGKVSMFGTPIVNGSKVISTGIQVGSLLPSTYVYVEVGMYLYY